MKGASHRKRSYHLNGSLLPLRAEGHTGSAKPALFRIHLNGRLPFFRIRSKGITHTNLNTCVAPRTGPFVEIDVFETHFDASLKRKNLKRKVVISWITFENVLLSFFSSTGPAALREDLIEWPLNEGILPHNIRHTSTPPDTVGWEASPSPDWV
jgi:hypothetical protein